MHRYANLIKILGYQTKSLGSRIPGLLYTVFIIYYKFVYLPLCDQGQLTSTHRTVSWFEALLWTTDTALRSFLVAKLWQTEAGQLWWSAPLQSSLSGICPACQPPSLANTSTSPLSWSLLLWEAQAIISFISGKKTLQSDLKILKLLRRTSSF